MKSNDNHFRSLCPLCSSCGTFGGNFKTGEDQEWNISKEISVKNSSFSPSEIIYFKTKLSGNSRKSKPEKKISWIWLVPFSGKCVFGPFQAVPERVGTGMFS